MRMSSVIMFAVAVVFGLVAVGATRSYLEAQRQQMMGEVKDDKPQATLVVAAKPMRFGAVLEKANLKEIAWASDDIPEGAFRRVSDILQDGEKRYVMSKVESNEPILASQITLPGQKPTLSTVVEEGKRAFPIRVNDVLGVAGFVQPGDRVDVMLTRVQSGEPYTDVLLQGLKVLAIDQMANERTDQPNVSKTVTFEVDTEQAQKLALGSQVGTLSLALRNLSNETQEATRRVTVQDLAPPEIKPAPVINEAGEEVAPPVAEPQRPVPRIRVYRGLNRTDYTITNPQ